MTQAPDLGRYARIEREHRYLLAAVPPRTDVRRTLEIVDWYVTGTRLRLRLVREAGHEPVHKLGQKIKPYEGAGPSTVAHTTMYLTAAEFVPLLSLPAWELRKTRRVLAVDGTEPTVVDEFHDDLAGLILGEIDLGENGALPSRLPWTPLADVTDDLRFTGGTLAATTPDQLRALLSPYRR